MKLLSMLTYSNKTAQDETTLLQQVLYLFKCTVEVKIDSLVNPFNYLSFCKFSCKFKTHFEGNSTFFFLHLVRTINTFKR